MSASELLSLTKSVFSTGSISNAKTEEEKNGAIAGAGPSFLNTIFSQILAKETSAAQQETATNAQHTTEIKTEANNIKNRTYSRAIEKINEINKEIQLIQGLLGEVEKMGEKVEEYNERLKEQQEKIEENKKILDDPEADKKEKRQALDNISTAGVAIKDLHGEIEDSISLAQEYEEECNVHQKEVDIINQEAINDLDAGNTEITQVAAKASGDLTADVAATTATGAQNTTEGAAKIAAGTPMLATPATAAEGTRLIQDGTDKEAAGSIRTTKSALTVKDIAKVTTDTTSIIQGIENYAASVNGGSSKAWGDISNALVYIGSFSDTLGSWENLGTASDGVIEDAEEAKEKLEEDDDNTAKVNGESINTDELDSGKKKKA